MAYVITSSVSSERDRPGVSGAEFLLASDEALNDSDKTLAGSAFEGAAIEIESIRIEFIATSTVGTRTLFLEILDAGSDIVYSQGFATGTDTVASGTTIVGLAPNMPADVRAAIGGVDLAWIPKITLHPDESLRIYDSAAVDAAADDMGIHVRGRAV